VLDVFVGGDVRVGEVEFEENGRADLRVDCDCWVGDAGAVVGSWRPEGEVSVRVRVSVICSGVEWFGERHCA
jgi:hypothetical protein